MEIRPFRGWRYSPRGGNVSGLICRPYDVLSRADRDALLARDPRNVVAVHMPHCPADETAPEQAYLRAGRTLRAWQSEGTMARDDRPCLYAYRQRFTWAGRDYVRRAIIAAVRLAQFGRGVWPHERTWSGPKVDRLRLFRAAGVQTSPVLGFYEDAAGAAEALFSAVGAPAATGELNGVNETLWAVDDPGVIARVSEALVEADVFIADGHHRYTTCLAYRDELGPIAPEHPANFAMFALAAMDDPGMLVLPAHRVIRGLKDFDLPRYVSSAQQWMECRPVALGEAEVADAGSFLSGLGAGWMALAAGETAYLARLTDEGVMDRLAADRSPAWRRLDVAVLHRLLIDHALADHRTDGMAVEYVADGARALSAARTGRADLVVFLQGTPLAAVRQVARGGEVMPHKSTYFYPKVAAGLVLYPLAD